MISEYKQKIEQAEKKYETDTAFLRSQLQQYFETVPKKATKTQETYKLPSGTLKRKFGGVEYVRDDEELLNYLKENKLVDYVKTKESVDWAEFKKTVTQKDNYVVDADGQVVEGVTLVEKSDRFEIEF
jgi:phage host-nuclease inhibitor protein Gam